MNNEKTFEKKTKMKINNLIAHNDLSLKAVYKFFMMYLRRQKILAFIVFIFLPVFFTCDILLLQGHDNQFLPLNVGIIFILIGFCGPIYTIGGFLVDLKNSVVYKRIGLTGIKPLGFLIAVSGFCLSVTVICNIVALITIILIALILQGNVNLFFNLNTLLLLGFSFFSGLLLAIIMQFLVIFINSSVGQSLVTALIALIAIGGMFVFNAFIPKIFVDGVYFFQTKELLVIIIIWVIMLALGGIFTFLNIKFFTWAK